MQTLQRVSEFMEEYLSAKVTTTVSFGDKPYFRRSKKVYFNLELPFVHCEYTMQGDIDFSRKFIDICTKRMVHALKYDRNIKLTDILDTEKEFEILSRKVMDRKVTVQIL